MGTNLLSSVNLVLSVKIKHAGPFETEIYRGEPQNSYKIKDVLYTAPVHLVHVLSVIELLLASDPRRILVSDGNDQHKPPHFFPCTNTVFAYPPSHCIAVVHRFTEIVKHLEIFTNTTTIILKKQIADKCLWKAREGIDRGRDNMLPPLPAIATRSSSSSGNIR